MINILNFYPINDYKSNFNTFYLIFLNLIYLFIIGATYLSIIKLSNFKLKNLNKSIK